MIYSGKLLKINGNIIPRIVSYKVGRGKLWQSSNRNMLGSVRATFIGVFPKIELNIGVTTEEEMSALTVLFDTAFFQVEYFDVRVKGATAPLNYYASDYDTELLSKSRGLYKPFTVSLIPVDKRDY